MALANRKKYIFLVLFLILFVFPVVVFSATHETDGSYAEVAAAMVSASEGDTITMPAGSFDWGTSNLTFNKNVTLQGAGMASTIIAHSGDGSMITINSADASGCRITGFRVNHEDMTRLIYIDDVPCVNFRFDHLYLNDTDTESCGYGIIIDYGSTGIKTTRPQGLIDNCTLVNCRIAYMDASSAVCSDPYDWTIWTEDKNLGGVDAVYVEDCSITNTLLYSSSTNCFDGACGSAFVVRYCSVTGFAFETHGLQGDEKSRSTAKVEFYRNEADGQRDVAGPDGSWHKGYYRAATIMIWQNAYEDYGDSSFAITDAHLVGSNSPYDPCTIPDEHDSSYGVSDGWLCIDQPGSGADKSLRTSENKSPGQYQEPVYIWGNTDDGSPNNNQSDVGTLFVADRDYFVEGGTIGVASGTYTNLPATCKEGQGYWCTDCGSWNQGDSTVVTDWNGQQGVLYRCKLVGDYYDGEQSNEWEVHYTPYTYPHPLRGETTPQITGITIASNGTTLTLAFAENVTQGIGYDDSDFDLDISQIANNVGLTYVSGNGTNTHIYTISQTVRKGETVDIDFNGDSDSLEDDSGNDLAAIVSDSVTNNSTQLPMVISGCGGGGANMGGSP